MRKTTQLATRVATVEIATLSASRTGMVVPLLTAEAHLKRALRYHLHQIGFKRTPEGA